MTNIKFKFFNLLAILLIAFSSYSQEQLSPDELLQQARKVAFEEKRYDEAINLCKKALAHSPDYTDIKIFLGRLYTWKEQPDSARQVFKEVLIKEPGNEDASLAYGSLEFWNDRSLEALEIVEGGLSINKDSKGLLKLKAQVLDDLDRFQEASQTAAYLLRKDPKNTEARVLAERLKDNSTKNKAGINYDFSYFDKQFDEPWHMLSVDYGRQTKYASLSLRLNQARRFGSSGTQVEVDAYPRISKTFYSYVSGGYSGDAGIFPKYRAGFSLYANLPAAFEAEAGFRLLHFSDNTWVYTISAGKYYKNFWFNLRSYLTPSASNISQSYSANIRYYYGGTDDYFSVGTGTGISPDDSGNNVLLNSSYKLHSKNVSAGFRHSFNTRNVINVNASWINQEYRPEMRGNQINIGFGFQRRF